MTTVFLKTKSSWQSSCLASKLLLTISFSFQGPKSAVCEPDWLLQWISERPLIFTDICFSQSQLSAPPSLLPIVQHPRTSPSPLFTEKAESWLCNHKGKIWHSYSEERLRKFGPALCAFFESLHDGAQITASLCASVPLLWPRMKPPFLGGTGDIHYCS